MANVKVEDYLDRVKKYVYNGQDIHKIENSLYQVGTLNVVMAATAPNHEDYFFGINPVYFDDSDEIVLICGNREDLCAFRIPTNDLKDLPFVTSNDDKERLVTTVGFDHEYLDWYLTVKKVENEPAKVTIDKYRVNLKTENEYLGDILVLSKKLLDDN